MYAITRRLEFDAGHRVLNHEGKCKNLHGHRYVVDVTVSSFGLDDLGRVVDFSVIKAKLGTWIDDMLDHNMLLHPDDPLLNQPAIDFDTPLEVAEALVGRAPYVMPADIANPTAENIAHLLYDVAVELLTTSGLMIESVRVWETPNCYADYKG